MVGGFDGGKWCYNLTRCNVNFSGGSKYGTPSMMKYFHHHSNPWADVVTAVITIQRAYRKYRKDKIIREMGLDIDSKEVDAAVVKLQAHYKGFKTRQAMSEVVPKREKHTAKVTEIVSLATAKTVTKERKSSKQKVKTVKTSTPKDKKDAIKDKTEKDTTREKKEKDPTKEKKEKVRSKERKGKDTVKGDVVKLRPEQEKEKRHREKKLAKSTVENNSSSLTKETTLKS